MNEPLDQLNPAPKPKMSPFGKIILGNFAIMLLYMVASSIMDGHGFYNAIFIVIQVVVNIFLGLGYIFNQDNKRVGLAFLLSGLMVAVIGPGLCGKKVEWFRQEKRIEPKHPS